jgi:hypothetical protein
MPGLKIERKFKIIRVFKSPLYRRGFRGGRKLRN